MFNFLRPQQPPEAGTTAVPGTTPAPVTTQSLESMFNDLFSKTATTTNAPADKDKNPWEQTPEDLSSQFGGLNVGNYISQEDITKALAGDAAAFLGVLNTAVKVGAMTAHTASSNLARRGVDYSAENLQKKLPTTVSNMQLEELLSRDEMLSAPAFKPVIDLVAKQVRDKYPGATNADIADAARKYLEMASAKIGSIQPTTTEAPTVDKIDWEKHFNFN